MEPERTTTDDLIVTTEGSGCSSDSSDEEDCEIVQPSTNGTQSNPSNTGLVSE